MGSFHRHPKIDMNTDFKRPTGEASRNMPVNEPRRHRSADPIQQNSIPTKEDIQVPMMPKEEPWLLDIQNRMKQSQRELKEIIEVNGVLKRKLDNARERQQEAERRDRQLQAKLYDVTKNIRVTDDDFSTIIAELGKFVGKVSNFPPNSKSSLKTDLSREDLVKFFVDNNDEREKESIKKLFNLEPIEPKESVNALISILVEKLITAEVVNSIFAAPIHLNPTINDAYTHIENLFTQSDHKGWIKDLRLKLSRATLDATGKYPVADKLHEQSRDTLVQKLVNKLAMIYDHPEDIKMRIEKIVDMAIKLSLPIRGQEDLIRIHYLYPGDEIITNQVKGCYRHLEGDKIFLGITPVFLANSVVDDEYDIEEEGEDVVHSYLKDHTLVYQGKAIW